MLSPAQLVAEVRTKPVRGRHTPRLALDLTLSRTILEDQYDRQTWAFALRRRAARIASPQILPADGRCLTKNLTERKRAAWSLPAVSYSHVSSEATMPDDCIAVFWNVVAR